MTPKNEIFALREQGFSYNKIAEELSIPKSTVGWTIRNPDAPCVSNTYDWKEVQSYYDEHRGTKKTISHFEMSSASWQKAINRGDLIPHKKQCLTLDDLLVDDRPQTSRGMLKQLLLKEGVLEEKCAECGLEGSWNNKPLVLQLEHKNGKNKDNRLENLCLLCPNCHSQTDTFAGKNTAREKTSVFCIDCGKEISSKSTRCTHCSIMKNRLCVKNTIKKKRIKESPQERLSNRKVERPSKEELEKLLWEKPTTKIAEQYDVSDKAVGKWAKSYGIEKPPRGYWQKQHNLI